MSELTDKEVGAAWTAHIVTQLFERHPRRCDFNSLDISVATDTDPKEDPEQLFDDQMDWLRDNGYVAFDQAMEGNAFNVALTDKGFAVLGSTPPGLEKPLNIKLKDVLKLTASEGRKAALGRLSGALADAIILYFRNKPDGIGLDI